MRRRPGRPDGRTYIQKIQGPRTSMLFETVPAGWHYVKTHGNDTFEVYESDAGIYITVKTFRDEICCSEQLYGMARDDSNFWVLSRHWSGEGHKDGTKYHRDQKFPVGKQVRLDKCLRRANPKSSPSPATVSS